MKRKLLMFLLMLSMAVVVFTISVFAAEYSVAYYSGDTMKEIVMTNEDGLITFKDVGYSTETDLKKLRGWFTYDGDVFEPGETVTLDRDIAVYEFFGFAGTNKSFTTTESQWAATYVQLQEDIVLDKSIPMNDGGKLFIDLNGHTITSSATNVMEQRRSGVTIVGEGKIIHTGTGNIFQTEIHGYDDRRVGMYVGKDVTIQTSGNVFYCKNTISSDWINAAVPLEFYGTFNCNHLVGINGAVAELINVVISPRKLVMTGDSIIYIKTPPTDSLVSIVINGGIFELPNTANQTAFWDCGSSTGCGIYISGGSFNCDTSIIDDYVIDGYKAQQITINNSPCVVVVKDTGCNHEYKITAENEATCVALANTVYTCSKCNDAFAVYYGEYKSHAYAQIEDIPPTELTHGQRFYKCDVCGKLKITEYAFDPSLAYINVTVQAENETKTLSVKVSDVLELEAVGSDGLYKYTVVGVKAFDSYAVENIIAVEIPPIVSNINFSDNATLKEINIKDSANVVITSFAKATALETINIGAATVFFSKNCSNNTIKTINSYKEGADVSLAASVFYKKSSLVEFNMSTKSTYTFANQSLGSTGIKEFIAPDYCELKFVEEGAFWENYFELVYIGRGITEINNNPFNRNYNLRTLILMEVTKVTGEWSFCWTKLGPENGSKPVEVYIHADTISFPKNAFYECHGATFYTNAPILGGNGFLDGAKAYTDGEGVYHPAFTIVYGIPHKYVPHTYEPGCLEEGKEGYMTDCSCGVVEITTYKIFTECYTESLNYSEYRMTEEYISATGHSPSKKVYIDYQNGYYQKGLTTFMCNNCNSEYVEDISTSSPLFNFKGYSTKEKGGLKITVGFAIHLEAIAEYEIATGKIVEYGIVAALADNLDGKAPLDSSVNPLYVANVILTNDYYAYDFIVSGFTDAQKNLAIVMSAYVKESDGENTTLVYLQENQVDIPTAITINSIK